MKNKKSISMILLAVFSVIVLGNIDAEARTKYLYDENYQAPVEKFESSDKSSAEPSPKTGRWSFGLDVVKDWWAILLPFIPNPYMTAPVK